MSPLVLAALLALTPADTLPVPHAYLDALDAGTRSRTGAPGADYWQQQVDYRIETELHPQELTVTGSEVITYHNNSPDVLSEMWLNLPQNVFAPGNPRNRPAPVTGGFDLTRVVVQGIEMEIDEPRAGRSLGTVIGIALPFELAPGATAELEIDWSFEVPEGTFRMGRDGDEVFYLAQWFPQVAVYDDVRGWAREPYMGDGEFYLEYGDYDVRITAPEGWLVSATGVLQNAREVLAPESAARFEGITSAVESGGLGDAVIPVVSKGDHDAGQVTATAGPGGTLTWHYTAENVRDFAWGSSNRYVWDATVAEYADLDGTTRRSAIHSLYRPDRANWDRSAAYARHAIENHSYWYPYPYPQMTVNEGVIGGGMEYPMITIIGGGRSPISLYSVISHELAHMWWPMIVGSNERLHAWMDEGLASFAEDLTTPMLFQGVNSGLNTLNGYLRTAGTDRETESMRPADLYGPFGNRGLASYGKPATVFRALRAILGNETFDDAMRTYTQRWAFKHPNPLDLFWTFEDVTGQDLDWYFHPWLYTTAVMDQALVAVDVGGGGVTVTVEDRGEITMPIILAVTTADGSITHARFGPEIWNAGRAQLRVAVEGVVTGVSLDPEQFLPDVNRRDNGWTNGG